MGFEAVIDLGGGGGSAGDLVGPASSADGDVAVFDGTSGKLAKTSAGGQLTSVVLGPGSSAAGPESVILGSTASSPHTFGRVVVIGEGATSVRNASVVIGRNATSTGVASEVVILGASATTASSGTVVVGASATAGNAGVAVGKSSIADFDGTALGTSSVGGNRGVAVGKLATTVGFARSQAYGLSAAATAVNQVVFGSTTAPVLDFQTGVETNGASLSVRSSSELLAVGTGATATTTNLIPAGASLLAVTARVTTAVTSTGAATFDVGDAVDPDRYGATIVGNLATTLTAANYTADPSGVWSSSPREIILSAPGVQSFTAGAVRICAHYTLPTAPTS